VRVGDRIAIKSTFTQRKNLPFDSREHTVSCMRIKAVGTVVANRDDGRTLEVEWTAPFTHRDWYFATYWKTIQKLHPSAELDRRLVEFTFQGKPQDYNWFCEKWWGKGEPPKSDVNGTGQTVNPPYSWEDIVASGVFLREDELRQVLGRLVTKKNLILQGAPGVGKTFLARKLAYALMSEKDNERIEFVQFHQSYSYEDFVRGYRPLEGEGGRFGIQDGVFLTFCRRANDDPDRPYVFIVDEINRGNLSQIFGELLMLIEADKRGSEHSVPLVYQRNDEPRFFVPTNLYLIGLMNLADRSLALVDYALRRRFAFMTLRPQYTSDQFRAWLLERGMRAELTDLIVDRLVELNRQIAEDPLLGENYQVGHSFFCPRDTAAGFGSLDRSWYEGIIETEVVPLLKEYWFDNATRVQEAREKLLAR
jgi:5-methylcytosine-specific restriction protein B